MPEVRVSFKNGKMTLKTSGFSGEACRDATKRLKDRIGVVESDIATGECYEAIETEQNHEQQQEFEGQE
jgi:hypothetical protein